MKTSAVKNLIQPLELDAEVKERINTMLANYGDDQEVPSDIKNQILELLDLEIETNELLAHAYDQITQATDQYHSDLSQEISERNN